jgi:hypothetical protein
MVASGGEIAHSDDVFIADISEHQDYGGVGDPPVRIGIGPERPRMASIGTVVATGGTGTGGAYDDDANAGGNRAGAGGNRARAVPVETSPVDASRRSGRTPRRGQVTPGAHGGSTNAAETNDDDNNLGDHSSRVEGSGTRRVGSTGGRDGSDSRQMPSSGTAGMFDHTDDSDNQEESFVDYGKRRAKKELSPTQVIQIFAVTMMYDQYAHAKSIPSCMKQDSAGVLMRNFVRCLDRSNRCADFKYHHLLAAHKFVTGIRFLELTAAEERTYDDILKSYRGKLSKDGKENWYEITHLDLLNIINKSLLRYGNGASR